MIKKLHKNSVLMVIIAIALLALLWFVFFTNPATISLSLLVAPPLCLFVALTAGGYLFFERYKVHLFRNHPYVGSILIGLLPVLYLLLRSLAIASLREVLLVVIFLFLLILYIDKRKSL